MFRGRKACQKRPQLGPVIRCLTLTTSMQIVACGGASIEAEPESPADKAAPAPAPIPPGSLRREDVVAVVDRGLGYFLQRVRVEPSLEGGQFSGFRILELTPQSFWHDVDLLPGDVVTQVNGTSIEYPNTALQVFESLRAAELLNVVLLRDGEVRQLNYPIVGAPVHRPAPEPPAGAEGNG